MVIWSLLCCFRNTEAVVKFPPFRYPIACDYYVILRFQDYPFGEFCRMTWIFAYGESMIEPELRKRGAQPALLAGYHRSFNHSSTLLWGTQDRPCPVLGLSPGGECWGLAFQGTVYSQATILETARAH